jgi:hypothetical protein
MARLGYAREAAPGPQVIRIECVGTEMELSFAAVRQLLRPCSMPARAATAGPGAEPGPAP